MDTYWDSGSIRSAETVVVEKGDTVELEGRVADREDRGVEWTGRGREGKDEILSSHRRRAASTHKFRVCCE